MPTPISISNNQSAGRVRCTQAGCGREFDTPLEIFDGQLICPHCGKQIGKKEFTVTVYNDNLTRLAEMYFGEYLSRTYAKDADGNYVEGSELSAGEVRLREKLLANALASFLEASRLGHPSATLMLGYFWEVGYMGRGSDLDRYKMAFHYYNNVCVTTTASIVAPDNVSEIGGYTRGACPKLLEVRKQAAQYLLRMLAAAPSEFENIKRGSRRPYSLVDNIKRMQELDLVTGFSAKKTGASGSSSRRDMIQRTLNAAIKNADHAPMFGYFIMPRSEFISLYEEGEGTKSFFKSFVRRGKNVEIYYAAAPEELEEAAVFYRMDAVGIKDDFLDTDSEDVYIFFVNTQPKLAKTFAVIKGRMSDGKGGDIRRSLVASTAEGINSLMRAEERLVEHVFYPEDVFFAAKRNKSKPITALAAYLEEAWNNEA